MNNNFEALHPRRPDGKFAAKPGAQSAGLSLAGTPVYGARLCDNEPHSVEEFINLTCPGAAGELAYDDYVTVQILRKDLEELEQVGNFKTPAYYKSHPDELPLPRGGRNTDGQYIETKEYAKHIRSMFKQAIAEGYFPEGTTASVRTRWAGYTGAIDVDMTVPEDFPRYGSNELDDRAPTQASIDVHTRAEAILTIFNVSRSDSMTDYFDETYYGSVRLTQK